jgi:primosomal protein N'
MYLLTLAPYQKSIGIDILHYYSSDAFCIGDVVQIPLRSSTILGIVITMTPLSDAKSQLKQAHFTLKKIPLTSRVSSLDPRIITAITTVADSYALPLSPLFELLIPVELLSPGYIPTPKNTIVLHTSSIVAKKYTKEEKDIDTIHTTPRQILRYLHFSSRIHIPLETRLNQTPLLRRPFLPLFSWVETISQIFKIPLEIESLAQPIKVQLYAPPETGQLLSPELDHTLSQTPTEVHFVYSPRKDSGTSISCADCRKVATCTICTRLLHVYEDKKSTTATQNTAYCSYCDAHSLAPTHCSGCGSWRIFPVGITENTLADYLKKKHGDTVSVLHISQNTLFSKKELHEELESIHSRGGIVTGGLYALSFLEKAGRAVDRVHIASIDSLLSLPVWDMGNQIVALLTRLGILSRQTQIGLSSRLLEHPFIATLVHNQEDSLRALATFVDTEKVVAGYPPHGILISFSRTVSVDMVGRLEKYITQYFATITPTPPLLSVLPHDTTRRLVCMSWELLLPHETWTPLLIDAVRSLPVAYEVRVWR